MSKSCPEKKWIWNVFESVDKFVDGTYQPYVE